MCTSPMKGFKLGINPENGKNILKIRSYDTNHIYFIDGVCHSSKLPPVSDTLEIIDDYITIPCGQCDECRLQRSRDWANRCILEQQYHEQSLFLTLTYNNENLPMRQVLTPEGELTYVGTLVKKDLSKFMKALRQEYGYKFDNKLRFFGCGEYGSKTMRPHFHVIVFGLKLDDLQFHSRNFRGDTLYTSPTIDKVWKKGFSLVGEASWEACAYTARYILKKQFGKEAAFYDDLGIEPEFVLMSRRPGIARQYYDDHPEMFDSDFISVSTGSGGKDIFPPKYFEKLFESDFPEEAAVRKEKKIALIEEKIAQQLAHTDKSYLDYLKDKEYNIKRNLNKLPREMI